MKARIVSGSSTLGKLKNQHVKQKWLIYNNVYDNHLPVPLPKIDSTDIIYNFCDKNFVCYTLYPDFYPKAQNIYLASHPCDTNVFARFKGKNVTIHLVDNFKRYKDRYENLYGENADNIKIITYEELKHIMTNLE